MAIRISWAQGTSRKILVTCSSEIASNIHFGFKPFQKNPLRPDHKIAEPVHFGAGVIEGRDAQEGIRVGLIMMAVFHIAGMFQIAVGQMNRFGGAGGARGKVKRGTVKQIEFDARCIR